MPVKRSRTNVENDYIKWSPSLESGIALIDEQHKGLIDMINDIYSHVSTNEKEEQAYFNEVIHKAVQYVKVHFETERKLMLATKFPGYAQHKKSHDSFILMVVAKVNEFKAGKRLTLTSFTNFLRDWVLTHVAVEDKLYFDYFRKVATRKADGKLSINASDIKQASAQ